MKPNKTNIYAEKLWFEAIEIIRRAPGEMLALEFEEKVFLLLSILGISINDQTICVAYHSALTEENLEWLKDRLEYQLSKVS